MVTFLCLRIHSPMNLPANEIEMFLAAAAVAAVTLGVVLVDYQNHWEQQKEL